MAFLTVSFYSPALKRTVPCEVILPTDKCLYGQETYTNPTPVKTLYLLHGVFGSCEDWVHGTRVRAWAEAANLCVVMPSGDNKFYADSDISGDHYGEFITRDLISFVENTFHVSRRREDRFIAGLSMGGYGAVVNGMRHPELYGMIAGMSSAFIRDRIVYEQPSDYYTPRQYCTLFGLQRNADFDGSANDYNALAEEIARRDPAVMPRLWLCCGTEDRLYADNIKYRDHLLELGFPVEWEEWKGVHSWKFWDEAIEKLIAVLPLKDAQAGVSSGNVSAAK